MRKLTGVERKHVRALAGSLAFGGEHKDDVISEVAGWLVSRGWTVQAARFRAREVALAALSAGPVAQGRERP